jgi:hypothetical protein
MLGAAAVVGLRAADTPAAKASRVEVIFSDPDKFTDAAQDSRGSDWGRDTNLDILKDFIVSRGTSLVPADDKLTITFTDIDLAGEYEPWRSPSAGRDARIVKDIYPPRMDLSFKLTDATGKVVMEGKRHLTNLTFLMDILPPGERSESLAYDRELLRNWLNNEFGGLNKAKK